MDRKSGGVAVFISLMAFTFGSFATYCFSTRLDSSAGSSQHLELLVEERLKAMMGHTGDQSEALKLEAAKLEAAKLDLAEMKERLDAAKNEQSEALKLEAVKLEAAKLELAEVKERLDAAKNEPATKLNATKLDVTKKGDVVALTGQLSQVRKDMLQYFLANVDSITSDEVADTTEGKFTSQRENWEAHNKYWGNLYTHLIKYITSMVDSGEHGTEYHGSIWALYYQVQNLEMWTCRDICDPNYYSDMHPLTEISPPRDPTPGQYTWLMDTKATTGYDFVLNEANVKIPWPMVMDMKRLTLTELSKSIRFDTEIVMETGSGWSRNIFHLTETGLVRNKNIRLYSGEHSISGRRICRTLSYFRKISSDVWPVTCLKFDYYHPTAAFEFVLEHERKYHLKAGQTRAKHAVIFSSASVEQIPIMPAEYIFQILSAADEVSVCQWEPLGWQLYEAMEKEKPLTPTQVTFKNAQKSYAIVEHQYSKNYIPLLKHFEKVGYLKVTQMNPTVVSNRMNNGYSFIRWIKLKEPVAADFSDEGMKSAGYIAPA